MAVLAPTTVGASSQSAAGATGLALDPTTLLYALSKISNQQTALLNLLAGDGLLAIGTLAIDATPEDFKTTTTAYFRIGGVQYSKTAAAVTSFTAAHVITASKFGIILVQINAAGTISTKVPGATQTTAMAYDTAALALAALPDVDADNVALGYIAIENNAGDWTANTDDLTDASDVTTAAFVDATPLATSTIDSVILGSVTP